MSSADKLTIITPPDRYYGADINVLISGFSQDEQSELILVLDNIDAECCLAINDMTPERDIEWMLDTAQKCSIIVLNLKWAKADTKNSIYYGWLLSKNNCYYVCDDETAKIVGLFNTNRVESIIEPIKQLEE
jgi:hypothetical protein